MKVYYLEYCITPGFTDSITKKISTGDYPEFVENNVKIFIE